MACRRGSLPDDLAEVLLALSDPTVACRLDREDRTSSAIRERLAAYPNDAVREATRRTAREWISKDLRVHLCMLEKLTDKTGSDAWSRLMSDPDPKVRRAVADAWFDAPDNVRRVLLSDPEPSVRAAACQWPPPAPPNLHADLIGHPATRAFVAEYISLTDELAAELAADDGENVRVAVAKNPQLPNRARDRLAGSNEPVVWANLICNQTIPGSLRARLHADLAKLSEEQEPSVDAQFAQAILSHENVQWIAELPLAERETYLESPYAVFRRSLARHGDLPAAAVARLQRDPDREVRRIIARRPDAPADFLERVVRECGENLKYRPLLVDHPNFPRRHF
jgi:hypothetical protein